MDNLDNVMDVLNSLEEKQQTAKQRVQTDSGRVLVGDVEHFYDKINVAAIKLSGDLRIGDTVELESEEYTVRQKIESMQINRKDVDEASDGESIGIKLRVPVPSGSRVYRID